MRYLPHKREYCNFDNDKSFAPTKTNVYSTIKLSTAITFAKHLMTGYNSYFIVDVLYTACSHDNYEFVYFLELL